MGEITETITFTFENAQQQRRFHEVLKEGWSAVPAPSDAKLREALAATVEALDQLLDDMGEHGLSVCQAAKDQARAALLKATQETVGTGGGQ